MGRIGAQSDPSGKTWKANIVDPETEEGVDIIMTIKNKKRTWAVHVHSPENKDTWIDR